MSFSKSLLRYLAAKTGSDLVPIELTCGRPLAPGEPSVTGLYAVCKTSSGWPLRVTLFAELADRWRHPSRVVRECSVRVLSKEC